LDSQSYAPAILGDGGDYGVGGSHIQVTYHHFGAEQ
jgi:hypothetical protein